MEFTYNLSGPQANLFITKSDMLSWILWAHIAPMIWTSVLGTLKLLLYNTKFSTICKIGYVVSIILLLGGYDFLKQNIRLR
jgi:hypothetical protein